MECTEDSSAGDLGRKIEDQAGLEYWKQKEDKEEHEKVAKVLRKLDYQAHLRILRSRIQNEDLESRMRQAIQERRPRF